MAKQRPWYRRPLAIAREYLPNASRRELGYVIWNHTGWPAFWTGDPETCFRQQLAAYAAAPDAEARP